MKTLKMRTVLEFWRWTLNKMPKVPEPAERIKIQKRGSIKIMAEIKVTRPRAKEARGIRS